MDPLVVDTYILAPCCRRINHSRRAGCCPTWAFRVRGHKLRGFGGSHGFRRSLPPGVRVSGNRCEVRGAESVGTLQGGLAGTCVGRVIGNLLRNDFVIIDELRLPRGTTPEPSCRSGSFALAPRPPGSRDCLQLAQPLPAPRHRRGHGKPVLDS